MNQTEDTNPIRVENKTNKKTKNKKSTAWILLGILVMILLILLGAFWGYQNGINRRVANEESTVLARAAEQYELALSDFENDRIQMAEQRIEYVLSLDPTYPGAAELLRQVLIKSNTLPTSSVPTQVVALEPTFTPTPDFRGEEEIYNAIVELMKQSLWDEAIMAVNALREKNLDYRAIDVDGFYYIALRNRGVEKIGGGNLEPGIYDLSLAERFAPLDGSSDGIRNWARLYLTGASFWEVNWEQVIVYFSQIQPTYPNLRDGSGMTATERYRTALYRYGDQLAAAGDFCLAKDYYYLSLAVVNDPILEPTAINLVDLCEGGIEQGDKTPSAPIQEPSEIPTEQPTEFIPTPTPEIIEPTEETPIVTETTQPTP